MVIIIIIINPFSTSKKILIKASGIKNNYTNFQKFYIFLFFMVLVVIFTSFMILNFYIEIITTRLAGDGITSLVRYNIGGGYNEIDSNDQTFLSI